LNIIKHYAPLKSLNIIYINMIQLAHFFMIHQIHFVITLTASSIRDQEMQPTRKICSTSSIVWTRINPYSQVKQPKRHYSTPWRTLY